MGGKDTDIAQHGRRDRLVREMDHDPYHAKKKLREPTVCPECSAVFHDGRWQWAEVPDGAHESLCPACERTRDRVPAGFLTLRGDFFPAHKDEIRNLIENVEQREKTEHPLGRIMGSEETDEGKVFTFTSPHITHAVGNAIESAYDGELEHQYVPDAWLLRAYWER